MNILEIHRANKSFGKKNILKNISFTSETGKIKGVFGKNGTGKSTLLKLIYGVLKADSIQIQFNSKTIRPSHIISSKKIAYLPQDSFLPKELKVRAVIPLFLPNGSDQDKIFYAPKVTTFENTMIGKLSIGQLRYLEILLVGHLTHPFLILDEPFSMIEPIYKDIIKNYLLKFKESKGIILTDHYYNDVLDITDYNFLINKGEKVVIDHKDDLIKFNYLNK